MLQIVNRFVKEIPLSARILIILTIISVAIMLTTVPTVETFSGRSTFDTKRDVQDVYDDFYVGLYDKLVMNDSKNEFEIGSVVATTSPSDTSEFLDIGSGTGHHVDMLVNNGYRATGIDCSKSMIDVAKETYPAHNFIHGSATDSMQFDAGRFTHITCMYFTIYYIHDKQRFFENCYNWLAPGGSMVVHLVNRDKFDPILPAGSPFVLLPPQKFAKKRQMDTSVKFDTFQYKAKFNIDGDRAIFSESFVDDSSGNVRKNEHHMEMQSQKVILNIAQGCGFILTKMTSMTKCGYEDQFLYTLQRPN